MIFVLALSNVNETNERPMDKLNFLTEEEKKILHKTLGVLVGTVGKQKAAEILDEILNKAQANLLQNDGPLPDRMVLLDTRTGRVEVGHKCGWGHLADRPHFVDITRRLADINIYRSIHPDDPHRLRCKVDGVQQTSVLLSPTQESYWQGARLHDMCDFARYKLAGEIYADLLLGRNQQNELTGGMKR